MSITNMKSPYLPALSIFIFLLLVDKSVSISSTSSIEKLLGPSEWLKKSLEAAKETLDIAIKKKILKFNNEQLPASVKQKLTDFATLYLYNYRYLQSQDPNDAIFQSALSKFQGAYNLQPTGSLDTPTLQKMLQSRCSVPDLNLQYTLNNPNQRISWPKGTNWSPDPKNLTYGFDSNITHNARVLKELRDSFQIWSSATGVNLTETSFKDAQIKVGYYNFFKGNISREEAVGITIILNKSQSSGNNKNDDNVALVFLEDGKDWVLPGDSEGLNLKSVVMHQIGHILGLEHSYDEESIMYPVFNPPQKTKVKFSESDLQQIKRLASGESAGGGGGKLISDKYSTAAQSGGVVSNNDALPPPPAPSGGGRVAFSWGLLILIVTLAIGFL